VGGIRLKYSTKDRIQPLNVMIVTPSARANVRCGCLSRDRQQLGGRIAAMVFFAAALNGAAGEEIPRRKGEGEMAFHLGSSIAGGCGGMYALL
jgi:hypothetical protein